MLPLCNGFRLLLSMAIDGTIAGVQSGAAVTHPHGNHRDVGSNPATARNEKRTLDRPLHKRCPNSLAGSQWKTGDVKSN